MKFKKVPALVFIGLILILTTRYILTNWDAFDYIYRVTLISFSLINIFGLLILSYLSDKRADVFGIAIITFVLLIILGDWQKSMCSRSLPRHEFDDFDYYLPFGSISPFKWHFLLDFGVLLTTLFLLRIAPKLFKQK